MIEKACVSVCTMQKTNLHLGFCVPFLQFQLLLNQLLRVTQLLPPN